MFTPNLVAPTAYTQVTLLYEICEGSNKLHPCFHLLNSPSKWLLMIESSSLRTAKGTEPRIACGLCKRSQGSTKYEAYYERHPSQLAESA